MSEYQALSAELGQLVKNVDNGIAIIIHQSPDGDALGSGLALAILLKKLGKKAHLVSPNAIADNISWLPTCEDVLVYDCQANQVDNLLKSCGLLVCVDFNDPRRAGALEQKIENFSGKIAVIDHHQKPKDFASLLYSDIKSPATAQLIWRISRALNWEIDRNTAICLYTGLITDTGSFRFSSVTKETHQSAGELVKIGIAHDEIHSRIYDSFSPNRLKLFGHCFLNRQEMLAGGKVSIMHLTIKDQIDFDVKKGDTEGLVNYNLSIIGVDIGVLFIEDEGLVKISFRSKKEVPVNLLAEKYFDGGGHINAAGGRSFLSIDKTIEKFKKCIEKFILEHSF